MKYEFTGETKVVLGVNLKRIRALISLKIGVNAGDTGGWIENEKNLSQGGDAWVYGDAHVYGNARVYGNAWVSGNARVSGNAQVSGDAWVSGDALVYGNARVSGNAQVSGNAHVYGDAWVYGNARVSGNAWVSGNARVSGNAWITQPMICASRSDGYLFVCAPQKEGDPIIMAGCRYFTFAQAREHWTRTRGSTKLGDESLALVDHLERMAKLQGWL